MADKLDSEEKDFLQSLHETIREFAEFLAISSERVKEQSEVMRAAKTPAAKGNMIDRVRMDVAEVRLECGRIADQLQMRNNEPNSEVKDNDTYGNIGLTGILYFHTVLVRLHKMPDKGKSLVTLADLRSALGECDDPITELEPLIRTIPRLVSAVLQRKVTSKHFMRDFDEACTIVLDWIETRNLK